MSVRGKNQNNFPQDQYNSQSADQNSGLKTQLSEDEIQVLRECNRESFYYRCIPLGVLFIGTTTILTKKGILKSHPKYGSLLKNLGAGLIAFIAGKVSYQGTCREKILQLENSSLADSIKKSMSGQRNTLREYGKIQSDPQDTSDQVTLPTVDSPRQNRQPTEYKGLSDSFRPTMDRDKQVRVHENSELEAGKNQPQKYEDLRAQNRRAYENKLSASDSLRSTHNNQSPKNDNTIKEPAKAVYDRGARRNKYGDIIDE